MRIRFSLLILGLTAMAGCGTKSSTVPMPDGGTTGGGGTGGTKGTGGGGTGGGSGGSDGGMGYPAAHPPLPQAQTLGGPVMTAPKVVAITFMGDTLQPDIDTFVSQMTSAAYWAGATAEYGVGALSASTPQHLAETPAATLTDADVQAWLTGKINGGADAGAAFPAPDGNTIYTIFYPATTTVTYDGTLCNDFQGYHSDYQISPGTHVTYAVVGRCPPPVPNLAEIDEVTAEASHEIIESATDPLPMDQPAYVQTDGDHLGWELLGGGEIGDLCAPFPDSFYNAAGITNLVQRVWSNKAAAASHDPCEPDGNSPYFNSAPVLNDTLSVTGSPIGNFTTKGVKIPVGGSATVELDLFSDAPTSGPWTVSVLDAGTFFGDAATLSFSLDKTTGQNGDKLHLTITALGTSSLGASPFWIQSDLGNASSVWIGLVGN